MTPTLATLLADSLTLIYGTQTLADGIQAAIADANQLVDSGHNKKHTSTNTGLRVYASEAGGCARKIAFRLLQIAPEAYSDTTIKTFLTGDLLHEALQNALVKEYPDFQGEKPWLKDAISGRADGLYHLNSYKTLLEIKSCNKSSFSFSLWKGPKAEHILQAAISALQFGADQLHIVYISKEPVKRPKTVDPSLPDYLSIYDWKFPLDEEKATAEKERLTAIALQLQAGTLPDRDTAFQWIDDPDLFKFPCGYCHLKSLCKELGPGELPISKLLELYPGHQLPTLELSPDQ